MGEKIDRGTSSDARVMQPEDIARLRSLQSPRFSPDGTKILFNSLRIDVSKDAYFGDLFIASTDRRNAKQVTSGFRDTAPCWSPDGESIAFLRSNPSATGWDTMPQLHTMSAEGTNIRRISYHPLGAEDPAWSPDSQSIVYSARVPEPGRYGTSPTPPNKEKPRRISNLRFKQEGVGWVNDRLRHLFITEPFAHKTRVTQVTFGQSDNTFPSWSPDGARLLFVSAIHGDRDRTLADDIYTINTDGTGLIRLTSGSLVCFRPTFDGKGDSVYFLAQELGSTGIGVSRYTGLWKVSATGTGQPKRLTNTEEFHLNERFNEGAKGQKLLLFQPNSIVTEAVSRGAVHLMRFGDDGSADILIGGDRQVAGADVYDEKIVAVVRSADALDKLILVSGGIETGVSVDGEETEEALAFPEMHELNATASDGYPVHGWVMKPAGPGPFPVILHIHGGPFGQHGYQILDEIQTCVGAGYAVVFCNPRGSSGYGEMHAMAVLGGEVGGVDADDILSFLDAAITQFADLDETHVGVLGGSYGGFLVSWLITQTDRFHAAVSDRAINNWESYKLTSDIGYYFVEQCTGPGVQALRQKSPVNFASQIRTPTLVIHSEEDLCCPLEQGLQMYVAMKLAAVEAELLVFPGEGHELSRSGLPSHRVQRLDSILEWFDRHLLSIDPPVGLE